MIQHLRGAYPADRAAALSGVPRSTVHYWARRGILIPSVSARRVKLWSYADLMALRTIQWLRHPKEGGRGGEVPASSMPAVRKALEALADLNLDLWTEDTGHGVAVDRSGAIFLLPDDGPQTAEGQRALDAELLDLTAPFEADGSAGPDLRLPRPRLRIVPGKLGGAPHIHHTRLETEALAALRDRGMGRDKIASLYPSVEPEAIDEALDLEQQLSRNAAQAA